MSNAVSYNLILTKYFLKVKIKGSSFVSPVSGRAGQGRLNNIISPPLKNRAKPKQAGKKEGGLEEGIFVRPLSAPKARQRWKAARPCVSKEAKHAKIVSLIEKDFRPRPLKIVSIFAGFVRRQATSRWAGLPPAGRQLIGVLLEMSSNFIQQTPPKFICGGNRLARRFAPRFGGKFGKTIPRLFERNGEYTRRYAAVHKRSLYCDFAAKSRWFSFAFGESQNEILLNCRCKALPFSKIKNF